MNLLPHKTAEDGCRRGKNSPVADLHLRRRFSGILWSTLEDVERCALLSVFQFDISLAGEGSVAVHGAARHPADHPPAPVEHRVSAVRHAYTFLIEAEAHDHAFALLFALDEGFTTDKPGLVGFYVAAEAGFAHAQVAVAALLRTGTHLVAVQ